MREGESGARKSSWHTARGGGGPRRAQGRWATRNLWRAKPLTHRRDVWPEWWAGSHGREGPGHDSLDAIKVGCLLLHREQLDLHQLDHLLVEERWRRGVAETTYVLPFLDGRCRSLPEAELLAYVVAAGLPVPEVNHPIEVAPGVELTPDQWYDPYELAIEYEVSQHQEDRAQYNADIDRYALYRRHGIAYEQVTWERMRSPKATVRHVHTALVERGGAEPPEALVERCPRGISPTRSPPHAPPRGRQGDSVSDRA